MVQSPLFWVLANCATIGLAAFVVHVLFERKRTGKASK